MLLLQLSNLLGVADAAGDNPVHQGAAHGTGFMDILREAVLKAPLVDILVDTLEQFFAVVVNKCTHFTYNSTSNDIIANF